MEHSRCRHSPDSAAGLVLAVYFRAREVQVQRLGLMGLEQGLEQTLGPEPEQVRAVMMERALAPRREPGLALAGLMGLVREPVQGEAPEQPVRASRDRHRHMTNIPRTRY
jgi:hypothetical protein